LLILLTKGAAVPYRWSMQGGPGMLRAWLAVACLAWGNPAIGATFERCDRRDAKLGDEAFAGARDLAMRAAAAVGDTPEYGLWFGRFSVRSGEEVRANLKAIHKELVADDLKAVCLGPQDIDCKDDVYAYVLYERPRVIHLCPSFFQMPAMADAWLGQVDLEDGTREGTIIHELSHFPFIAGTGDECYGRTTCANMAGHDAPRAIGTADSYQYFAEDVTWAQEIAAAH
jgi:peptidyl-Lys metalloendopeptidase